MFHKSQHRALYNNPLYFCTCELNSTHLNCDFHQGKPSPTKGSQTVQLDYDSCLVEKLSGTNPQVGCLPFCSHACHEHEWPARTGPVPLHPRHPGKFFFCALSPVITHVYQNTGTTQLVYNLFTAWVKKQNSCSVFFMLYPLNRRKIGAQKRCPIEPCVPPPYWNEVGSDQIVARHLSGQRSCLNLNAASCEPKLQGGWATNPQAAVGSFLQQKVMVHPRSRPIPMITKVATQLTMLIF